MNSKLRWSILVAMSIACLILVTLEGVAITVDVDPEDLSTYDEIEGTSHTAVAITDIAYSSVKWYVDGSLKETDYGSGSKRIADFTYTFNSGSTTGREYEIKAIAFDSASASDSDAYDLTIWSDLQDVRTPSRSVSNEMEVNGSYAFSFSLTTPNSNYRITSAEVLVDDSLVASEDYNDVTSATIAASGSLGINVGSVVAVKVRFTWTISGTTIALYTLKYLNNVLVRSSITGTCTCATENNALDSGTFSYSGTSYDNATTVTWDAGSAGEGEDLTSIWGTYSFTDVPCGYNVTLSVDSIDTHIHGTQYVKTCFYEAERNAGQVGTRWCGVEFEQDHQVHDFDLFPDRVEP